MQRVNVGAELIRQRAGPLHGPVGQMHALDAALDQPEHDGARRAAGAQHQRIFSFVPSGRAGVEIVDKTFDVGVGRAQFVPPWYHSVLAAPTALARSSGTDSASARSLCGMVTLAPTKPWTTECNTKLGKLVRRHRLDDVAALDAQRPQPVMMDQRRARMRRRPSDQACGAGFVTVVIRRSCCNALETGVVAVQIGQAAFAVNAIGGWSRLRSR